MPLVYACICPTSVSSNERVAAALSDIAGQISSSEPDILLVLGAATRPAEAIGIVTPASAKAASLSQRIRDAAAEESIRMLERRAAVMPCAELLSSLPERPMVSIATSRVAPRRHFEFGRASGRAVSRHEGRVTVICGIELSAADRPAREFGERYRRAIEAWDVKRLVGVEPETRRLAGEDCVAQTALLMGMLSWHRIQPRVLAYDDSEEAGMLVAAIDVLGERRRSKP